MISIRIFLLLAFAGMQLTGMERVPRAKRRLFQDENKDETSSPIAASPINYDSLPKRVRPVASPGGYGTASDAGTPVKSKELREKLKINDVGITNMSGRPALIAYLGQSGQTYKLLNDFNNSESKIDSHLSAPMNLGQGEIYISAIPEQFRVAIAPASNRLLISKVFMPERGRPSGFRVIEDFPYKANAKLTIKIRPGRELSEPLMLEVQY